MVVNAVRRRERPVTLAAECRAVIARKVDIYADHLNRGQADGLWDPTDR